ncbi:MAG: hypothetical protein KDK41_11550 [Leptospiraceae bacterium]|nr:hypothetical protein [Leptospiraceae bacterium]
MYKKLFIKKCIFYSLIILVLFISGSCRPETSEPPWVPEVRNLLVDGTAFIRQFTQELNSAASEKRAIEIMENYSNLLNKYLARKAKLQIKYPVMGMREFPKLVQKHLPLESSVFISAFREANAAGEMIAQKYNSEEFRQAANSAWRALFDGFQFR